jgi:selenocysteine lyase/cysteine desulfurase
MNSRRDFLRQMGVSVMAAGLAGLLKTTVAEAMQHHQARLADATPDAVANDEDYWRTVRLAFSVNTNWLNLNNGGVSPQPTVVQDTLDRFTRMANEAPTYTMWEILDSGREPLRARLAQLAGADAGEIAINRNATEAIDTPILGLKLNRGDEVILTKQDYPNMINAWKLREKRDGLVLKWVDLDPLPLENDDTILDKFRAAITPRSKVLHITHMINWVGQLLPVQKLVALAKQNGLFTIVDGAHTFAQVPTPLHEWGCDYFGRALHKWLCAPFGTGLMYVRKERISDTYPIFPNPEFESDKITKFEALGTRNIPAEMAVSTAIDFHQAIGAERKEARLRYLKDYWARAVKALPGCRIHTSFKPEYACALGLFSIEGKKPVDIVTELKTKHRIISVAIDWENMHGVRITPHVYTTPAELDRFAEAVRSIAAA